MKTLVKNLLALFHNNPTELSDGYHTIDELYYHRYALFIALTKSAQVLGLSTWLAYKHYDGTYFQGYFLVCVILGNGEQISYHIPEKMLKFCSHLPKHDIAPIPFDGHTSGDVVERLLDDWLKVNS
jgi:hypothetical protein